MPELKGVQVSFNYNPRWEGCRVKQAATTPARWIQMVFNTHGKMGEWRKLVKTSHVAGNMFIAIGPNCVQQRNNEHFAALIRTTLQLQCDLFQDLTLYLWLSSTGWTRADFLAEQVGKRLIWKIACVSQDWWIWIWFKTSSVRVWLWLQCSRKVLKPRSTFSCIHPYSKLCLPWFCSDLTTSHLSHPPHALQWGPWTSHRFSATTSSVAGRR